MNFEIKKLIRNCQSGFTLIEVLIYSVILAVFLGASFSFVASILGTTDNLLERNEVIANREFVERKFNRLVTYAGSIIVPAANSSSTQLKLQLKDADLDPAVFNLDGDVLTLSIDDRAAVPIVNNRIKVTSFNVEHFVKPGEKPIIRIYLALKSRIYSHIVATSTYSYVLPR